jgi:glycosyltransferase involved in cell wall biosynthesis
VIFAPSGKISRQFKYTRHVDRYIAISRAVADTLRKTGVKEGSISIIPSALDIGEVLDVSPDFTFRRKISPHCNFIVISAGALTSEKDFDTAVRTAKIVSNQVSDIGLVILGDGPKKSHLKAMMTRENISNVWLLGHREPIAPIFKAAHLFLLTSASEGLNSSAIEAAACGLPLVVSDVGGLPEIAEEGYNGFLCEPGKPESFAAAILKLYKNSKLREMMVKNSVSKAKQFDIGPAAKKTADLYNRLLAE